MLTCEIGTNKVLGAQGGVFGWARIRDDISWYRIWREVVVTVFPVPQFFYTRASYSQPSFVIHCGHSKAEIVSGFFYTTMAELSNCYGDHMVLRA